MITKCLIETDNDVESIPMDESIPMQDTRNIEVLNLGLAWRVCGVGLLGLITLGCRLATDGNRPATASKEWTRFTSLEETSPPPCRRVRPQVVRIRDSRLSETPTVDSHPIGNADLTDADYQAEPLPVVTAKAVCECGECPIPPRRHFSFEGDCEGCLSLLRDDAKGVVNWNNAALVTVALAGAIGMRQDLDEQILGTTTRHPRRWGKGSENLGKLGEPQVQIPVLLSLYYLSLKQQDEELHDLSGSLISAYTITGLSTLAVKGVANTDRPSLDWNGGKFGFPSYHTASSFALAAVVDEYHGPKAGLPAYTLAGLIGWSRLDERDHELSDVFFGAALGYVIGKSIAGRHLRGNSRVRILPYAHPTEGTSGLMLDLPF